MLDAVSGERVANALPQDVLYGLAASHLTSLVLDDCGEVLLETHTANAFKAMAQAAKDDGITLSICSAYRPFERQLAIWNAKAAGKRTLLDEHSRPVAFDTLSPERLLETILLWSALPGASRHHWGTDCDVFDASRIDKRQLQLIDSEYQADGVCGALSAWLDKHAARFGFYFPYQAGLSGTRPEPWHLSYFPIAAPLLARFQTCDLRHVLACNDVMLKSTIETQLDALVERYVRRVAPIDWLYDNM